MTADPDIKLRAAITAALLEHADPADPTREPDTTITGHAAPLAEAALNAVLDTRPEPAPAANFDAVHGTVYLTLAAPRPHPAVVMPVQAAPWATVDYAPGGHPYGVFIDVAALTELLAAMAPGDRLDAAVRAQGVRPVQSIDELAAGDPIPEDEMRAFTAAIHGDDEAQASDE